MLTQTSKDVEALLRKEVDDLRGEIEELSDLVKVKDRMLDDQNIGISQLKQQLKGKDEEMLRLEERQGKQLSRQDDKVAQANEEAERQRQRADDCQFRIQELEEELDSLQRELQDVQDESSKKAQTLQEKQELIDLVMLEVEKIRDQQEGEKRATHEKDAVIDEMGAQIEQLTRQNETKTQEISTLIEKMEGYKRQKDGEVAKIRKKLAQSEEDIKVLIMEQERQKKVANEKIKMLHEMFK